VSASRSVPGTERRWFKKMTVVACMESLSKVVKVFWLRQAHISLGSRLFFFPEREAKEIRWVSTF